MPEITVKRAEKLLKSPPAEIKKDEAVAELFERKTDLRRSASRMKGSLEQAMCRGDVFKGEDLVELMNNVILKPMLERLVFIGEGIAGYLVGGGKALRDRCRQGRADQEDREIAAGSSGRPAGVEGLDELATRVFHERADPAVQTGVP